MKIRKVNTTAISNSSGGHNLVVFTEKTSESGGVLYLLESVILDMNKSGTDKGALVGDAVTRLKEVIAALEAL